MMRIIIGAVLFASPATAYVSSTRVPPRAASRSSVVATRSPLAVTMVTVDAPKSEALVIKQASNEIITEDEVVAAQRAWADGVVAIGKAFMDGGDFKSLAVGAASSLYAYDYDPVLFKPTRCADKQFRPTALDALSYFIGKNAGDCHISEDGGFAIQPWSNVRFNNHAINVAGNTGIAMGNYFFTDAYTKKISKVEYTFGYRKFPGGKVRIFLHHSSVPYAKPSAAPAPAPAPAVAAAVAPAPAPALVPGMAEAKNIDIDLIGARGSESMVQQLISAAALAAGAFALGSALH